LAGDAFTPALTPDALTPDAFTPDEARRADGRLRFVPALF